MINFDQITQTWGPVVLFLSIYSVMKGGKRNRMKYKRWDAMRRKQRKHKKW